MRLNKVKIQNFRGIASLDLGLDRDTTVLIGENNSGKTSVIEALRLGLETIKSGKTCNFTEFDFYRHGEVKELSACQPIVLTFTFEETEEHPWSVHITQALNEIIVGDKFSVIKLRLTGWFDKDDGELKQNWCFLDDADNEMIGKHNLLKDLRKLRPFFFQSALRAAKDEFHGQATLWSSFLKSKDIDESTRKELESKLGEVNRKIVDAHASFTDVVGEMQHISRLVSVGKTDSVSVDPSPADVYKFLRYNTDVNLSTDADVKIPIGSHGEGTQSLSVLLLFSAYLKTRLKYDVDKQAEPIIAIEEPESHLHPNAVRAIWPVLKDLPGQKIIATHSGDILSEVPVEKLRRMFKASASVASAKIESNTLTPEELRKFNHHVRRNRGELLFAKSWLLVEGETDVSVFSECAEILEVNLHRHGIRIVEYGQADPGIFIKVADSLGIKWHLVADNDDGGKKYIKSAKNLLNGKSEPNFISVLSASNIDVLLCQSGYGDPYLKGVITQSTQYTNATWVEVVEEMKRTFPDKPSQALSVAKKLEDRSRPEIKAEIGTAAYWQQVYACLNRRFSKPAAALEAILLMKQKGKDGVPREVKDILNKLTVSTGGTQ